MSCRQSGSALLRALLDDDPRGALEVLHPDVTLTRADGEVVRGAEAVVEGVRGGRYEVRGVEDDALRVALHVPALPTPVCFTLRASASQGRLVRIEVALDPG